MSRLTVVPIVEGHGEVPSVRILLERIWYELLQGEFIEVLQPIRQPRGRLASNKEGALEKALNLAAGKLRARSGLQHPKLILILLDRNTDLPCQLAPSLLQIAHACRADQDVACVIANVEYETWFVAAAASLSEYLDLSKDASLPETPEKFGSGKAWIEQRFKGRYSETVDQPRLTARMDLHACRSRSLSFDKLCRDLEARMKAP